MYVQEGKTSKIVVNSCISKTDKRGTRVSKKSCAVEPQGRGRHTVGKFGRTLTVNVAVEDSKKSIILVVIERLKTARKQHWCGQ